MKEICYCEETVKNKKTETEQMQNANNFVP